jgi:hypothetical protein
MDANLVVCLVIGAVFAVGVGALAMYRKHLSNAELDVLHISDAESNMIGQQEELATRIAKVDRWGKVLTVGLVIYCVVVASVFLYHGWQSNSKIINQ